MPHKYEREIEEILRNMERTEPKPTVRDLERPVRRPMPGPRLPMRGPNPGALAEGALLLGVLLALVAAGIAYYFSMPVLVSGVVGVAALVLIVFGLVLGWSVRFRGRPDYRAFPRTYPVKGAPSNVVTMRRNRRGVGANLKTRVRLLWLKLRFWRQRER